MLAHNAGRQCGASVHSLPSCQPSVSYTQLQLEHGPQPHPLPAMHATQVAEDAELFVRARDDPGPPQVCAARTGAAVWKLSAC